MKKSKAPRKKEKRPSVWSRMRAWLKTAPARCMWILLIGTALLCLILCLTGAPERYSLTVGGISRQTIAATKDVVDEIGTAEARRQAASAVEPTYHLQEGISDTVMNDLSAIFNELSKVQQYGLTLRSETDTQESIRTRSFTDEELGYAQNLVTLVTLSRYQITTLLRTETADFDVMVSTVTTAVQNALNSGIREGKVNDANITIRQIVGYRVDISLTQNILPTVLSAALQPNLVVDQAATEAARQKAMDGVEPVVYLQGQNIVREGEVVRLNQYEMVRSLGLLQNDQYDMGVYAGAVMLVFLGMGILVLLDVLITPQLLHDPRKTAVQTSVMVISAALCAVGIKLMGVYAAPLSLVCILCTVLLGWRAAVPALVSSALLVAGLAAGDSATSFAQMVAVLLMELTGGVFAIRFLDGRPLRIRTVLCGVICGLLSALILVIMALMTSLDRSGVGADCLNAATGGLIGGLIAVGLQPVFEGIFNLATPSKLMELGNPNNPLLRKLLLEAPGTYHHSIIVANLAEAAAEAIGANPILARTGAYFHDVGKLKRPQYFKENQVGDNPLDVPDPYVAATIVTSHTRDGIQMAQKFRLPPEIQKIIAEHHGDTPTMFFYHKALQMSDGKPVDIADFRYAGPRPSSKEAAIVMLADTIEAAIRSMPSPTPQSIQENIERLVRGKLEDGQLSDCPLSLKDIDRICEAFAKVLNGVFHERIEYPKTDIPKRGAFLTDQPQTETKEAPAEKKEAPAEKKEAPAEKKEAPAEKKEAPAEKKEAPAEKKEAPAEKKETPADAVETAAEVKEIPAEKSGEAAREPEEPSAEDKKED